VDNEENDDKHDDHEKRLKKRKRKKLKALIRTAVALNNSMRASARLVRSQKRTKTM
jgi:hypothetical protein